MTRIVTIETAYLEALEFTDCGPDDPERADATWSENLFTHAEDSTLRFINSLPSTLWAEVSDAVDAGRYSWTQFGHDLWFTRNGHGTGFWDRGLAMMGDDLSDHAQAMGEVWTYVTDDGELDIA
jgi:hypothetical protein